MFENKKLLKKIQSEKEELLILKEEIKKEYEKLFKIKEILEEKTPKIDINDVYDFYLDGIHTFVKMEVTDITGLGISERSSKGYHSTLKNIFDNSIVYEKKASNFIEKEEYVKPQNFTSIQRPAYIRPIHELDRNLLAYTDKQVPLYVLQRLYYELNNVDINSPLLKQKQLTK